jgi:Arc/MetJ-type ribon-helix-helix transcriptional regulator
VADGLYPSKAAALEAAVEALREKNEGTPMVPEEHMAMVEEAIESLDRGEGREMTDADWEELRQLAERTAREAGRP